MAAIADMAAMSVHGYEIPAQVLLFAASYMDLGMQNLHASGKLDDAI